MPLVILQRPAAGPPTSDTFETAARGAPVRIADDLVAAHEPWWTQDLEDYLRAVGGMFAEVEMYSEDTDDGPGWSILLDPDRCPVQALPYLAQYVGERLPPGLSEAAQREWIKDAPNQIRGTLSSIVRAAQRRLDVESSRLVTVIERDGGADKITVVTYTSQTPSSAAVLRELYTVVPGDMTLNYEVTDGQIWSQVAVTYATWGDVTATGFTWARITADTPSGTYGR